MKESKSIRSNQELKDFFLKYEGSINDWNNVTDEYLTGLATTFTFAGYRVSRAFDRLAESMRESLSQTKLSNYAKSKFHK